MTEYLKDLTEKQGKTYDLLSDFASNNSLPFSIKAHQIGQQVGYKVTPGEKEGYEPSCSGTESCMQALRERSIIDYDVRRYTGFIVKNVKIARDSEIWMKDEEYEYQLDEVIKFDKGMLLPETQATEWIPEDFAKDIAATVLGKTVEELKEEKPAKEKSIKIKINEISDGLDAESEVSQKRREAVSSDIILSSLATLEEWRKQAESELIKLSSRIDQLENAKMPEEAGLEADIELSVSRDLIWDMMYLGRFFRTGVRRDNNIVAKRPEWQEFTRISRAINGGVGLIIDSYQHENMHVAEMSSAIVVVLNARDYPKYFISMNQEETELYTQCSEMFNEFDINDYNFNSKGYCETSHWKIKREQKFAASPLECSKCHRSFDNLKELNIPIQVHHKSYDTYSRIFHENLDDLVILCKDCHEEEHSQKKADSEEE